MAKPKNVDEYIAQFEGNFAEAILKEFRSIAHETVPQLEEKLKWGAPSFEYQGRMFGIVGFKNFVSVWFDKGVLMQDPENLLEASSEKTKAMRKYSVKTWEEINRPALKDLMRQAFALNEKGKKVEGLGKKEEQIVGSPLLEAALKENETARANFASLTPGKQREYWEFIESAKQEATQKRRLTKALGLLEQGLGLNDKYR